jgi:Fic family protein
MAIDVEKLLKSMLAAAKEVLIDKWPEIRSHAEVELKGIAEGIALIEKLRSEGKITEEQAVLLLDMKKNTAKIVLLTIEGLGILAVEQAINAALNVVKETVNASLDFALL